jgi:hypothetical protein
MDITKFKSGLSQAKNMITLPQGSIVKRPGTRFVRECGNTDFFYDVRLIPFIFSNSQSFVLEFGHLYMRVHTLGATVMDGAVPYEIVTPYTGEHVNHLHYVQSGDVITLTHPEYEPRELSRISNTNWTLTVIDFTTKQAAPPKPTVVTVIPVSGGNNITFRYKITAVSKNGYEESRGSPASDPASNDLTLDGNENVISWTTTTGAAYYNVYKQANGTYGFIGQTKGLTFTDDNIIADMTRTIPVFEDPFDTSNPTAVGYFEQRRIFAGTTEEPMNLWATQSGSDYNMAYTIPSQDSNALRFRMMSNRSDQIQHLVNLQDLLVFTGANIWRVTGGNGALTPSTINVKIQSQIGATPIQPQVVTNIVLFAEYGSGHIREMTYSWEMNGYKIQDLSILAAHLFDGNTINDMAYMNAPWPILWCVSSDGKLLGMTYSPEHEVMGWHQHTTGTPAAFYDGGIRNVCVIPENGIDALYMVVNRTIDGTITKYIERMEPFLQPLQENSFYVDCGLTYSGTAATVISGLDHLEGKQVAILGDGAVMAPKTVIGGSITLETPVTKAQIGLPFSAYLTTLPVYFDDTSLGQSRVKSINKVWARVQNSGPFEAGPSFDKMTLQKPRTFESYGQSPLLKDGEYELTVMGDWNQTGQIIIRQSDPLPFEVIYLVSEVSIGG